MQKIAILHHKGATTIKGMHYESSSSLLNYLTNQRRILDHIRQNTFCNTPREILCNLSTTHVFKNQITICKKLLCFCNISNNSKRKSIHLNDIVTREFSTRSIIKKIYPLKKILIRREQHLKHYNNNQLFRGHRNLGHTIIVQSRFNLLCSGTAVPIFPLYSSRQKSSRSQEYFRRSPNWEPKTLFSTIKTSIRKMSNCTRNFSSTSYTEEHTTAINACNLVETDVFKCENFFDSPQVDTETKNTIITVQSYTKGQNTNSRLLLPRLSPKQLLLQSKSTTIDAVSHQLSEVLVTHHNCIKWQDKAISKEWNNRWRRITLPHFKRVRLLKKMLHHMNFRFNLAKYFFFLISKTVLTSSRTRRELLWARMEPKLLFQLSLSQKQIDRNTPFTALESYKLLYLVKKSKLTRFRRLFLSARLQGDWYNHDFDAGFRSQFVFLLKNLSFIKPVFTRKRLAGFIKSFVKPNKNYISYKFMGLKTITRSAVVGYRGVAEMFSSWFSWKNKNVLQVKKLFRKIKFKVENKNLSNSISKWCRRTFTATSGFYKSVIRRQSLFRFNQIGWKSDLFFKRRARGLNSLKQSLKNQRRLSWLRKKYEQYRAERSIARGLIWRTPDYKFERKDMDTAFSFSSYERRGAKWLEAMLYTRATYHTSRRVMFRRHSIPREHKRFKKIQRYRKAWVKSRTGHLDAVKRRGNKTHTRWRGFNNHLFCEFFSFSNLKNAQKHFKSRLQKRPDTHSLGHALTNLSSRVDVLLIFLNISPTIFWSKNAIANGLVFINGQRVVDGSVCLKPGDFFHVDLRRFSEIKSIFSSPTNWYKNSSQIEWINQALLWPKNFLYHPLTNHISYIRHPRPEDLPSGSQLQRVLFEDFRLDVGAGLYH